MINSFILSLLTAPYFLFNAPPIVLEAANALLICPSSHKGAVLPTLRNTAEKHMSRTRDMYSLCLNK